MSNRNPLPHPRGQQYTIAATTKGVEKSGHIRITVVTLGHDVADMQDTMRIDLCDHPLYRELHAYVLANPPG